jgi:hypothetical protein
MNSNNLLAKVMPNEVTAPDAASSTYWHSRRQWRGPVEFCRWVAMRALHLTVCCFICGCSSPESPQNQHVVSDATGTNLLALTHVVTGRHLFGGETDYDFHSLVWKSKVGTDWVDRCVISKSAFQASRRQLRWVSDIDSFDTGKGTAVIKVAEESVPITNSGGWTVNVVYSWREWSLLTNGEIRVLRVCGDPFEKYTR